SSDVCSSDLDLPLLADAYRRGLVSWCQARLLIRVVRAATQSSWIRFARQVTVRRLEDVIIDCEVRAAEPSATANASAPAHIGASPLPPTEPSPADQSHLEPSSVEPSPAQPSAADTSPDSPATVHPATADPATAIGATSAGP